MESPRRRVSLICELLSLALGELLPGVMNQLGLGQFMNAANAAKSAEAAETPAEDDVPELVENFEDVSNE